MHNGASSPPFRKRCKRYDEPGHAHYLTFSCFRRQPFLAGRLAPAWFLEAVDAARTREPFDLWAYVVMPEHAHLLILPAGGSKVARILYAIKRPLAGRVIAWAQRHAPDFLRRMEQRGPGGKLSRHFWQAGGGYDRNLWSAEQVHEKIQYVHANPVRRGLVADPADWPWSSWRAWENGLDDPIRIDRESLPVLLR